MADPINGDDLRDSILGLDGDDVLDGGGRTDTIFGGNGNDMIYGGGGGDLLYGDGNDDLIFGGAGGDQLFGGDGTNLYDGGAGNDVLRADPGAFVDTFYFADGAGEDKIYNFHSGEDKIDFTDLTDITSQSDIDARLAVVGGHVVFASVDRSTVIHFYGLSLTSDLVAGDFIF